MSEMKKIKLGEIFEHTAVVAYAKDGKYVKWALLNEQNGVETPFFGKLEFDDWCEKSGWLVRFGKWTATPEQVKEVLS